MLIRHGTIMFETDITGRYKCDIITHIVWVSPAFLTTYPPGKMLIDITGIRSKSPAENQVSRNIKNYLLSKVIRTLLTFKSKSSNDFNSNSTNSATKFSTK